MNQQSRSIALSTHLGAYTLYNLHRQRWPIYDRGFNPRLHWWQLIYSCDRHVCTCSSRRHPYCLQPQYSTTLCDHMCAYKANSIGPKGQAMEPTLECTTAVNTIYGKCSHSNYQTRSTLYLRHESTRLTFLPVWLREVELPVDLGALKQYKEEGGKDDIILCLNHSLWEGGGGPGQRLKVTTCQP